MIDRTPVAVVGAGAAGLAATYHLRQAGFNVRLFDRNSRVGGKMLTTRRDGFMLEEGPSAMASSYHSVLRVAEGVGMNDQLIPASGLIALPDADGRMHYIDPTHILRAGLLTRLVSTRSKLQLRRLVMDLWRTRKIRRPDDLSLLEAYDHQSAEEYARERFGDELTELLVDPCTRSLTNCAASEVSAADLIYVFGTFMGAKGWFAFREGMTSYAETVGRLANQTLGAEVLEVNESVDESSVTWRDAVGQEQTERFAGVVLATDAITAARVHAGLDAQRRATLSGVNYTWSTVTHVALEKAPDLKSCFIFPRARDYPNLVILSLEHNKTPWQTPPGKGLVAIYPSSPYARELFDKDDDYIAKNLIAEAEPLIPGLGDGVEFTHISRWNPTLLQSRPGYWQAMRKFTVESEATDRRVQLAGDYFSPSSLNTASASGERAARRLVAALASSWTPSIS
jgi:oxygen-dependent protoporphyrinogen oxidase